MGVAGLFFVEPGVKVDGKYSQDVLHPTNVTRYQTCFRWQFRLPAGQRTCTSGAWYSRTPAAWNSWFHFSRAMAPNSPDVAEPCWLYDLGIMQQRVYEMQIHNVDELKRRLVDVWSSLQQSVVDAAVSEWRKRLQACVDAKGGHFEHLL